MTPVTREAQSPTAVNDAVIEESNPPESLTVVIVTYRCLALARRCIQSVLDQETTTSLRVVVVDNHSGDGTVEALRAEFPTVVVVESSSNSGFARACNVGIRRGLSGDILLLNPDTILPPDALKEAMAVLCSRSEVGMLGCRLVREDGTFDHACKRDFPTLSAAVIHLFHLDRLVPRLQRRNSYVAGRLSVEDEGFVDAVNGAFMLVRRSALDEVGLLDESYWMYGEDLDWCKRFWLAGWKVLYSPTPTVVHLKGAVSGSPRGLRTNLWFHLAMWRFYRSYESRGKLTDTAAALTIFLRWVSTTCIAVPVRSWRVVRITSRGSR